MSAIAMKTSMQSDERGRRGPPCRDRLRADRAGLRRLHRPPQLPRVDRRPAEAGRGTRAARRHRPRRRLRHRQGLHAAARPGLEGDRLPTSRRRWWSWRGPKAGARVADRGRRHARAAGLRQLRPRPLPRRRDQLPALGRRSWSRRCAGWPRTSRPTGS